MIELDNLTEHYLQANRARYSPNTLATHQRILKHLHPWCQQQHIHQMTDFTRERLAHYPHYLQTYRTRQNNPLSKGTQAVYIGALKAFFKWLTRHHHIHYNPAIDLKAPHVDKLPKQILTRSEAELTINQPNIHTPLGLRDRALLETLYSTGIRRMELCQLKQDDINFEQGILRVRQGKGGKDRFVPIGDRALAWINRYLENRPKHRQRDDNPLFLTEKYQPLTPDYLTQHVRKYLNQANIDKPGSCHLFRHTCATVMLENGANVRYIQAMLGHSSLDTTQRYTQVAIPQLKAVHARTHPAEWARN